MDAFIFRFEMLVKSYAWSDDTKFLALSNLLTGDSLRVLQTLSLEQQNYNYLKQALLKKFSCTAADYNNKLGMLFLYHRKTPTLLYLVWKWSLTDGSNYQK